MESHRQVDYSKYDELTDNYKFDKRGDADAQVDAYTYQKKLICAILDPDAKWPKSTAIWIASEHVQVGKTALLDMLVTLGYAFLVNGVPKGGSDAATVSAEMNKSDPDGQTVFQKRPVMVVNLDAGDKRLDNPDLYSGVEAYTDGGLRILPGGTGWGDAIPIYLIMGNDQPKVGLGEVGARLSAPRLNCYELEGIGESYLDEEGQDRYLDYDLVISSVMINKAKEKGNVKFQNADYGKKARDAGVTLEVYIFFETFVTFDPHPKKDEGMMPGKEMAKVLIAKNDCFKPFLSGNGPQFEMAKFHEWLKANGELTTPPGFKKPKYKLNGGSLGEMLIEQRNPSGTKVYNLKRKPT
jgi:hypothetical protein